VLQKRTTNNALKAHTVNYLKTQTKSFEYTRKVLHEIYAQTEDEVKRLGGNKLLEKILEKLGVPEGEISGEDMAAES
jgi:geranylgeranyl diphosphate synthase type 3